MDSVFIMLVLAAGASYLTYVLTKKEDEEAYENLANREKERFSELIVNREDRLHFEEYDEDKFWELVDRISTRSASNYQNFLGLFRDYLRKLSPQELIELDNLLFRLVWQSLNQDLLAAAYIMLKSSDVSAAALLLNLFITRGRVFYNQAKTNPNLIIGKEIEGMDGVTLSDLIADRYYVDARKLIPIIPERELEIPGEKWVEKDLPTRFPELWKAFF